MFSSKCNLLTILGLMIIIDIFRPFVIRSCNVLAFRTLRMWQIANSTCYFIKIGISFEISLMLLLWLNCIHCLLFWRQYRFQNGWGLVKFSIWLQSSFLVTHLLMKIKHYNKIRIREIFVYFYDNFWMQTVHEGADCELNVWLDVTLFY